MTTEPIGDERQMWAPQSSPPRWGLRTTAAAVGVATAIAAIGGAAIYAATDGGSHSFGASHQALGQGGGMPAGPGGQHGSRGGPGPGAVVSTSLHGEFVVPDGAGGYTTELTQTGTVTAISPTSVTVRSEDGFSQTYVIPSAVGNAGARFATDDRVVVRATRNGQTATVTDIGNPQLDGPGGPGAPPHRN
ncbi:MAG: hypothetical protein QOF67_2691 [Mycobacterium sp.]|jgi:hypothetical protein|nr:hypothetical protein [Mycobacterium sp.]